MTPTRKVTAGAIGGAASVILVWGVKAAGLDVPAEVAAAFTTVLSFVLGYWTTDDEA